MEMAVPGNTSNKWERPKSGWSIHRPEWTKTHRGAINQIRKEATRPTGNGKVEGNEEVDYLEHFLDWMVDSMEKEQDKWIEDSHGSGWHLSYFGDKFSVRADHHLVVETYFKLFKKTMLYWAINIDASGGKGGLIAIQRNTAAPSSTTGFNVIDERAEQIMDKFEAIGEIIRKRENEIRETECINTLKKALGPSGIARAKVKAEQENEH